MLSESSGTMFIPILIPILLVGWKKPCNSICGENYFFKLVARKLSNLQISIWKDRATEAW